MRSFFFLLCAAFAWGQQPPVQGIPGSSLPPAQSQMPMPAPSMVPPEAVVLTVGEDKLTKAQFDMLIASLPPQQQAQAQSPKGRRDIAEKLVEIMTLAHEAKAKKLDQSPKVQTQMKLAIDQLLATVAYRDLAESTPPNDEALKAYYEEHKGEWEEVKARHILIRFQGSKMPLADGKKDLTEAEALTKVTELRAKIVAGADFAVVAKESSDDTGSGANGGDLGPAFGRGAMVPEFEKEAFALPVGQISQPVKSPFGYHLIKVESHGTKPFDEVKVTLMKRMPDEMAKKALADLKTKKPAVYNDAFFK